MITRNTSTSEKNSTPNNESVIYLEQNLQQKHRDTWLEELSSGVSDPQKLLDILQIDPHLWGEGLNARRLFAMRVPMNFVNRMTKGDANDPLLRQVLPIGAEFDEVSDFTINPLEESPEHAGLLHKYKNRVLLIVKGSCAINCRYCFRRHFPYQDNQGNKSTWQAHLDYIQAHPEITEVILSGGDPLMAKDHELAWLVDGIAAIKHVNTLRIHTRLPVVIPSRITPTLCQLLQQTRLQVVLVTHINHANEINDELAESIKELKEVGVHLLNQSVLLKGVNDSVEALTQLSQSLFKADILPYYLHLLDKVQGAAHFYVSDECARELVNGLLTQVSGYLVPKLVRETPKEASKTPLDLRLS